MNLEDQYHAAAMLRITQEDARRIAELEAERDNAWEELREIRAAISANPEESTLDEVVKLRQQLAAALAACKVKDEVLRELVDDIADRLDMAAPSTNPGMRFVVKQGNDALATQPDDSALKAWLGEPVAWTHSCPVLCLDGVELWIDKCPHCGKPAPKAIESLRQQLAAAQDEIDEQARIVGMGGEREIDLRQKLDIVSSLLREAAGRMSYGHWSSEFRGRVESALKTKGPKL